MSSTTSIRRLDQEIRDAKEKLDAAPPGKFNKAHRLDQLRLAYAQKYEVFKDVADLDSIIKLGQEAMDVVLPGIHGDRVERLTDLATRLEERYARVGEFDDLEKAIQAMQKAIQDIQKEIGIASRRRRKALLQQEAVLQRRLGVLFRRKFLATGSREDFDRNIIVLAKLVEMEADPVKKAAFLTSLSDQYAERYCKEENETDLRESIKLLNDAAFWVPKIANDASFLQSLASRQAHDYLRTGDTQTINDAIFLAKRAVDLAQNDQSRAKCLHTVGWSLGLKGVRVASDYLNEAIKVSREAARLARNDDPDKITYLYNLDGWLGLRYAQDGAMSDLDEMISVASRIGILAPYDEDLTPLRNNNFGILLLQRYQKKSAAAEESGRGLAPANDLETAIKAFQAAVRTSHPKHPHNNMYEGNLAYSRCLYHLRIAQIIASEKLQKLFKSRLQSKLTT
ncbi:hypothetical protein CIB48_g3695 [Xylaria polymorpha]|nr:hypothetical protein CIB48_g3695 [Xylaria polymorpha]